jgi:CBS domain-containing protein
MSTVADLLKQKGKEVYSLSPDATIFEALRLMADKQVGALVVMEHDILTGIISERDFVRRIAVEGKCELNLPVKNYMTIHLYTVTSTHSLAECMEMMTNHRIRHLPVVDGDRLVGLISIGDVVKQAIAVRQERIEHLEDYMSGKKAY